MNMKAIVIAVIGILFCVGTAAAGHGKGRHGDGGGYSQAPGKNGKSGGVVASAANPAYAASCGTCHTAYLPQLLPSASWKSLMGSLGDHYGTSVTLEEADKTQVETFLGANAADTSGSKLGKKITASLGGTTPTRITTVPYLVRQHAGIPSDVFKRASVGSLANCAACHQGAAQGGLGRPRIPSE